MNKKISLALSVVLLMGCSLALAEDAKEDSAVVEVAAPAVSAPAAIEETSAPKVEGASTPASTNSFFVGVLSAIDVEAPWIKVLQPNGIETMVMLDKETTISEEGKQSTLAELKTNDNVKAEAMLKDGHYVAKAVDVV